MTEIFDAFRKAIRDIFRPQVLLMVAVPILCATALWLGIGWFFWEQLTQWVNGILFASRVGQWIAGWAEGVLRFFATVIALALLAPGILITAMVITEFFTMPGLVNFVAQRYYPELTRNHGGTVSGSIANSTIAIAIFALLWLVTLPLWFTGIGALVVPVLNSAYLNQRIFRHDALSDHASREELHAVTMGNWRRLFLLGLLLAVFFYVPFVNVLAPALTGLAFTHYQLGRLAKLRLKTKLGFAVKPLR
ncbi:MAG TPA: EI24 domain-containing protein [Burkholderiales bacterium]|nr:EI24 domain-containing protein [Burkholderiales bacterium]